MPEVIYLGLFMPLAGFLGLVATYKTVSRKAAGLVASGTLLISFLCFAGLLSVYTYSNMDPVRVILYNWIPVPGIHTDFALTLDPLSLLMTLIITGVGFLIHVYSIGYMEQEADYARFFAFMNFFVFSMLLLVLAGNLLLLFVGWEGVGLASYLLIGFWYTRPAAAHAATKAFVINRIGDLGFLLGLLLTFYIFGTSDISEIISKAQQDYPVATPFLTLLTLLLFIGAIGKSAQFPLYAWLPDAMEGPTPVSALIHAATMVTAGVYLIVRMHPIFMLTPTTLHLVGLIGGLTSLFAALCALAQTDLKRVLAYSTISQLGLMFLACGCGAFYAAMFHLTTHAFIKALLFLSAGNIVHMMHGTTEMAKMGGLSSIFTKTRWLFLIGALALSGIPPLSAFFSKDLILEQEHLAGFEKLFYVGLTASILTAFYMTRAYCLTFKGVSHVDPRIANTVKEAPKIMLTPVMILAFLSVVGGFLGFAFGKTPLLEGFLAEVGVTLINQEESSNFLFTQETLMSVIGGIAGVGSAYILYTLYVNKLGRNMTFLRKSFYINEVYWGVIVLPLRAFAQAIAYWIEPRVIDASVKRVGSKSLSIARFLQRMQSGEIRSYVAWMVIGAVAIMSYFVF
jgi:NADH-quinone oxidoreductase subunit L